MICDDTTINAVEKFDYNGEILLYDHVRKMRFQMSCYLE